MSQFFKYSEIKNDSPAELHKILCCAMDETMSVCVASSSALVANQLTTRIHPDRMNQYKQNSHSAINSVGKIRSWLLKLSAHLEENKISFLDARAPIKQVMQQCMAGNCEHQAFYLAALLTNRSIPAFIYNIDDIEHSVVLTNNYLLDPWAGMMFCLETTDPDEFYCSSLTMKASWLNRLLSNKRIIYSDILSAKNLGNIGDLVLSMPTMGA